MLWKTHVARNTFALLMVLCLTAATPFGQNRATATLPPAPLSASLMPAAPLPMYCEFCLSAFTGGAWAIGRNGACAEDEDHCSGCRDMEACEDDLFYSIVNDCNLVCAQMLPLPELQAAIEQKDFEEIQDLMSRTPEFSLNASRGAIQITTKCGGVSATFPIDDALVQRLQGLMN